MRLLSFQVEATDEEVKNFFERFAQRSTFNGVQPTGGADDGEGAVNPNPPALDKNGVPWMAEIHASTKGQTNEGFWRGKKGVEAATRKATEDAWKAANPNAGAVVQPNAGMPGMPGGQPTEMFTPPAFLTGGVQQPSIPVASIGLPSAGLPAGLPSAGLPGFTPPAPKPITYDDILAKYHALAAAGKADPNAMNAIYGRIGLVEMSALQTDETLRNKLMAELNAIG